MLLDQALKVEEGLGALVRFTHDPSKENAKTVDMIEEEADELRRIIADELNHTFVTPIDREDIFTLSRAVDDIMDYGDTTVEEMVLFEIEPNDYITKMVDALYNAAKDISLGIRHLNKHPGVCSDHLMRAKKAENFIEHCYRQGLVELFKTNDVIKILKTREVYRHLSNAADRVSESADIIGDILVKIT